MVFKNVRYFQNIPTVKRNGCSKSLKYLKYLLGSREWNKYRTITMFSGNYKYNEETMI